MYISKTDVLVTSIITIFIFILLKFFIDDVNFVIRHDEAKSTAVITFKKNKAQRQFDGSLRWERLQNTSPVYNKDTIRTGSDSEAALNFEDGTKLDLADNTLIQIRTIIEMNTVDFKGGNISFRSGGHSKKGMTINTSDGSVIQFDPNSTASLIQSGDEVSVGVNTGSASVIKDGVKNNINRSNEMTINTKSGEIKIVKRLIYPQSPVPDHRFIGFDTQNVYVDFVCESEGLDSAGKATLEVASTPDFVEPVINVPADFDGKKVSVRTDVPPGSWFWRIKFDGKQTGISNDEAIFSSVRRFTVYSEPFVKAVVPLNGDEYSYRKKQPSIAISWTESKYASAYFLEVAKTEDFKDPIIKTRMTYHEIRTAELGEGVWYWRVTPIYSFSDEKYEPVVNSFKVIRNQEIGKPVTSIPTDGTLYEIAMAKKKGLGFSWVPHAEAVSYEFAVAKDIDMKRIVTKSETTESWLKLSGDLINPMLTQSVWYWAVRSKDSEGNWSIWSDRKKITGVDAIASQRLIYPPDKYIIADSLITNVRFAWRSNIPAKKIIQVSSTPKFEKIIYEEAVETETMLGKKWPIGKWYWRLRTLNTDGSIFLDSEIRSFSIIEPLPAVYLKNPQPNSTVVTFSDVKTKISWEPVSNADYYSVEIYADKIPVFERGIYEKTEVELTLSDFENATWSVTIRAGANEKDNATRLLGYIGVTSFVARNLKPIVLNSPEDKAVIPGLTALRKGVALKWESEEKLKSSVLILSKDQAGNNVIYKKVNPKTTEIVQRLSAGTYYYNVKGVTVGGYDIMTKNPFGFVIEPIPLLPEAVVKTPPDNGVINFDYLKQNRAIKIEWEKIDGATEYDLKLYKVPSFKPLFQKLSMKETSVTFTDLSKFSKGSFKWEVEARAVDSKGNIEQKGKVMTAKFKIDLPDLEKIPEKPIKGLYGK